MAKTHKKTSTLKIRNSSFALMDLCSLAGNEHRFCKKCWLLNVFIWYLSMINTNVDVAEMTVKMTSRYIPSECHVFCTNVAFEITLYTFSLPFYVL